MLREPTDSLPQRILVTLLPETLTGIPQVLRDVAAQQIDLSVLAPALERLLHGDPSLVGAYSSTCLDRVWRSHHFSWWLTTMLHRTQGADDMEAELQLAQLRYLTASRAAATSLADNYTGYPDLKRTTDANQAAVPRRPRRQPAPPGQPAGSP